MEVMLPKSGKYVVAVSGGADSVSLLHMLQRQPGLELMVAHFDHGIRPDSRTDRKFVERLAKDYGLPFIYKEGHLGAAAGEAVARAARYEFLHDVRRREKAIAVLTAHHRDDILETAILNMLRGTGRKGLTSLDNQGHVERPLLKTPKNELREYAQQHGLEWREDSTNQNVDYLRNYVRHRLLSRFTPADCERLWEIVSGLRQTNRELDDLLLEQLRWQPAADRLDRLWFTQLSHDVALEMMAAWLRSRGLRCFDGKTLERLPLAAKTAEPGKRFDVLRGTSLAVGKDELALVGVER